MPVSLQMGWTPSKDHEKERPVTAAIYQNLMSPNISSYTRSLSVLGGRSCGISCTASRSLSYQGNEEPCEGDYYQDNSPGKCPLCDTTDLDKPTLAEHVITNHTKSDNSWSTVLDSLTTVDPTFFSHVICFLHVCIVFVPHSVCIHVMPGRAHST